MQEFNASNSEPLILTAGGVYATQNFEQIQFKMAWISEYWAFSDGHAKYDLSSV
jgi:hypothetical protein